MDPTSLETLARWSGGKLLGSDLSVSRVCTDTRRLQPGDLYIALKGDNFDGHTFVANAAGLGAAGALVNADFDPASAPGLPLVKVKDTLLALQAIAKAYRASLPLRVIGITGSSGKTSTKDFTAAVLATRYRVTRTEGNLNNHIGLPLTILAADSTHEIGVFEMGMNHPGEIAPLADIAAPDAAIITNIGVAHLEYMGSREAIALEKGMLAEALSSSGVLILKADDDFSASIAVRSPARSVLAGITEEKAVTVRATVLETGFAASRFRVIAGNEVAEVTLPVPGVHMIENALLALAAGLQFGVSLAAGAAGLADLQLTKGRLEQKTIAGIHILDDTYNANPDSMRAALKTLASLPTTGARIAVLGRMGELGAASEAGHRSVGEAAAHAGVTELIVVGEEAAPIADAARAAGLASVHFLPDTAAAGVLLAQTAREGDVVLIKGSRSSKMERVLDHPRFSPPA